MEVSCRDVLQDMASKDEETSSSSLPSPSPELSPAQAWSQEHSADTVALPPSSLELPRAQTWSLEQSFQQRDSTATTNSTSLPSPPLDLSIGSPWIESKTNVFDSLFELHTEHSFSECGTTSFMGLELDTSQSAFGHGHSISDSCTNSEHDVMSSFLGVGAELNTHLPVGGLMTSFMSAEDLVQALVTPVSDLIKARDINDKATPAIPLCVWPNDLFVETAAQGEKIDQGNPTTIACSLLPPPQGTVSAAPAPAAAARRVRFDMTPYIKLLDPTRVTGPPEEPDEEHIDDIMRNARWEYRWDKDLRQEHKLAKWASFNAHLHAAFPVEEDDMQATDERQSDQFSTEDRSTKKHSIDSDDTDDFLADERPAKKSRAADHASSDSCNTPSNDIIIDQLGVKDPLVNSDTTIDYLDGANTTNDQPFDVVSAIKMHVVSESQTEDRLALNQHPDFDEMIKDDEIGRSYRLFRWNLCYPAFQIEEFQEEEMSQEDTDDLEY
ncbi:hypothetical protein KI688_002986 [Linnemannia hyalina]|uniref:Uncharacterized protein n=1 Tax=Linnemannia hyalina TaxID=64524 RepID=A0A9P7XPK0_9FUNG|nr:hypothetical protein KI688_002986 [Linnemannia hyalina]